MNVHRRCFMPTYEYVQRRYIYSFAYILYYCHYYYYEINGHEDRDTDRQ